MPKPLHLISKRHYNRLIAKETKKLLAAGGLSAYARTRKCKPKNQSSIANAIPDINLQEFISSSDTDLNIGSSNNEPIKHSDNEYSAYSSTVNDDIHSELSEWAITHNISNMAENELLGILKPASLKDSSTFHPTASNYNIVKPYNVAEVNKPKPHVIHLPDEDNIYYIPSASTSTQKTAEKRVFRLPSPSTSTPSPSEDDENEQNSLGNTYRIPNKVNMPTRYREHRELDAQHFSNIPSGSQTINCSENCARQYAHLQKTLADISDKTRQIDSLQKSLDMLLATVYELRQDVHFLKDPVKSMEVFNLLPEFPLLNADQLEQLESNCKLNEKVAAQFTRKVASIGGKDFSTCTRKIMKSLFTNNCLEHYTWCGFKKNKPVKEYTIMAIILESVSIAYSGTTVDEVETTIKRWLHYTKDRLKK